MSIRKFRQGLRHESYLEELLEHCVPYYALGKMAQQAYQPRAGQLTELGPQEAADDLSIDIGYLHHFGMAVASRLGQTAQEIGPLMDEALWNGELGNITGNEMPVPLKVLAAQAANSCIEEMEWASASAVNERVRHVNLDMAATHASLYETGYDIRLLPHISLPPR